MNYWKKFAVKPGSRPKLERLDPDFADPAATKKTAAAKLAKLQERLDDLQFRLYSEGKRSFLICLQGSDASGKDGVVRHVFRTLNPEGCRAVAFKEPTAEELSHDFLWRIERKTPRRGEIVVFNRSHYEDVLIARVRNLVPKKVWSKRYDAINDFERRLAASGTHILKFFLHISKEEQLERFRRRLEDPRRQWKIAESDYLDREYWDDYAKAYEVVFQRCSTKAAPWFIIPSNRKWFRNLAVTQIIVEALEDLAIRRPEPSVDIDDIRRRYHEAAGR